MPQMRQTAGISKEKRTGCLRQSVLFAYNPPLFVHTVTEAARGGASFFKKGANKMNKSHANPSIECTIDECANHCDCEPCCALDRIEICSCGTQKAENKEQTACASFRPKQSW